MATVTGLTAERTMELVNDNIVGGEVNSQGHLILLTRGGETINAGPIADVTNLINSLSALELQTDGLTNTTNTLSADLITTNTALAAANARLLELETAKYSERVATSPQNLSHNTYTRLDFHAGPYNNTPWDTTNKQFTIPFDGLYQMVGAAYIGNATGGRRVLRASINGNYTTEWVELFPSQANTLTLAFSTYHMLLAGDTYAIDIMQSSGVTVATVVNSAAASWIKILRVK